jgi:single-strand DNA-binding protein
MSSFNQVTLMGNLTRQPELAYTPSGFAVCKFGIAINEKYGDKDEPVFVDIECWKKTAENVNQYLEKGSPCLVSGKLKLDQWEDKNGGGKRSKLKVVAYDVRFIGARSEKGPQEQQGPTQGSEPYPF